MVIDIVLLVFAVLGFWLGYSKGIVATLFSILCYVLALLITLVCSPWFSGLLIRQFHMNHLLALILGTMVFFILPLIFFKWLVKKAENYFKQSKRNSISKILGGIVLMLVGMLVYSLLLWLINYYGLVREKDKLTSKSYKALDAIHSNAKSAGLEFKDVFNRYWELMQESNKDQQPANPG